MGAMGKVYRLTSIQRIPASPEATWKFFSDPHNLQVLTPPYLNLKMTTPLFGDEVYAGQVMTYTVKPLFGLPLGWMTVITQVQPHRMFVDEQRKGPYRLWHHQHHFRPIAGGVEMTDLVHYRLPAGLLGGVAHRLLVKSKLQEIFTYRYGRITELFGHWPGGQLQLQMD